MVNGGDDIVAGHGDWFYLLGAEDETNIGEQLFRNISGTATITTPSCFEMGRTDSSRAAVFGIISRIAGSIWSVLRSIIRMSTLYRHPWGKSDTPKLNKNGESVKYFLRISENMRFPSQALPFLSKFRRFSGVDSLGIPIVRGTSTPPELRQLFNRTFSIAPPLAASSVYPYTCDL